MNGIDAVRRALVEHWLLPLAIFAVIFALAWLARRLLLKALRAWTARTGSRPGALLTEALRGPSLIWALIFAAHLAVEASELPQKTADSIAGYLGILLIISLTVMGMRMARDLVRSYGGQAPGALPVTTLTQNLAQIGVLVLGLLVLFGDKIQRITPILTALGVGGLAVALALQDTLSNLFAGFYVAVAGQIRLGDYIKLNTGEEGYVTDIGWRSTTFRALGNNLIIVPNSKLAQANVTNYHLPEKRMAASVQVGVAYDCDPDHVERVLLELAAAGAREIPGMLAEPAPSAAFDPGFGESALAFTLNFHVAEFVDQFAVRNELRKRIFRAFQAEGIRIPFPTRTVHLDETMKPAAGDAQPQQSGRQLERP
jgi:small-conductance mechanosensitive channel